MLPTVIRDTQGRYKEFQWAPTLGGECYGAAEYTIRIRAFMFQRAPTLGGECYYAGA